VLNNMWEEAALFLTHAGEDSGDPRLPMMIMADLAREHGTPERYLQFLQRATEAHPKSPEPWLRLCDLAIQMQDRRTASDALENAKTRGATPEELSERQEKVDELSTGVEAFESIS
jgi:cytochrome c-type biogenesis protein CcmH/NrfG